MGIIMIYVVESTSMVILPRNLFKLVLPRTLENQCLCQS